MTKTDLVAIKFRQIRKGLGITQLELGNAVGVSDTLISHIEHGRRKITKKLALRIQAFLKSKIY